MWEYIKQYLPYVTLAGTGGRQDTVLFSDTIRHNLKYGNENASDEQIRKAMEMSRCDDMLQMLPQGYDTLLTGSGESRICNLKSYKRNNENQRRMSDE